MSISGAFLFILLHIKKLFNMKNGLLFTSICLIAIGVVLLLQDKPTKLHETDYIVNFVDDSIVVYHNDKSYVGTVKLEGQLDSLIIIDNE